MPPDLAFGSDDDGLVARVRAGDETAFDAIYERYHRKLLAFCRHMVGSREEAEDVLQHTFVSAYRALRRTEEPVALRPWLYTIARNRCLSTLRARTPETDLEGAESELRSFDGLAAEVHRRSELRDLVHDIKTLPEEQRAALVLFELGDHSHEEIAHVLGIRREKVKALVFQAREGLMRARRGREASCHEIREQLASSRGAASKRSLERLHVDRCPACKAYESDVRRQRTAIAAVLPVLPSVGLKSSVLGSILGGGGGLAAAGGGAAGGGAAVVTAGGAGGASAGGASMATGALGSGATAAGAGAGAGAGGAAGAAAGTAAAGTAAAGTAAGGLAAAGAGAGVVAAEVGAAGGIAGGLAGLGVQGVVAKVLTVVAVAGGAGGATAHEIAERREPKPKSAEVVQQSAAPSAPAATGVAAPAAAAAPLGGLGIGALAPIPPLNLTPVVFEAPPLPAAAPDVPVPAEPGAAQSLPPAEAPAPAPAPATETDPNVAEPIIPFDASGEETTQPPPPPGGTVAEITGTPGGIAPPVAPQPDAGVTAPVDPVTTTDPTTTDPTTSDPTPTVPPTTPGAEQPVDPGTAPLDPTTEPGTTDPPPTTSSSGDTPKDEGTGQTTTPSDGGAEAPLGSTATG